MATLAIGPQTIKAQIEKETENYRQLQGEVTKNHTARLRFTQQLQESGVLDGVKDASEYLRSHVAARFLNGETAVAEPCSLARALNEAVQRGCPQLAEEAHSILATMDTSDHVGALGGEPEVGGCGLDMCSASCSSWWSRHPLGNKHPHNQQT